MTFDRLTDTAADVAIIVTFPAIMTAIWGTLLAALLSGPSPILALVLVSIFAFGCMISAGVGLPLVWAFGRFLRSTSDAAVFGGCIAGLAACATQVTSGSFVSPMAPAFLANLGFAFVVVGFAPGYVSGALIWMIVGGRRQG